jgi:hypothetical protein
MFCSPKLVSSGTEGTWSNFNVLQSRTRFRRYRVRFSCFALLESFWAILRASGLVLLFCAPGPVLGVTEASRSSVHILRSCTHFRRYRWRRVLFSYFVLPILISAVPRALVSVFMFFALGTVLGGTDGAESRFYVFRTRTHFRCWWGRRVPFSFFRSRTRFGLYRGLQILFSCFALSDSFSVVPRASGPIFMFAFPDSFWAVRGRRVRFSCFTLPNFFLPVSRASGLVLMFCVSGLV